MKTIFTIGHSLPRNRAIKKDSLVNYLRSNDIKTVIDVRYLTREITGDYSPSNLMSWLNEADVKYLSRRQETYLFYSAVKNITVQPNRSLFFTTHFIEPLVSFIEHIDEALQPIAILFNSWDTYSLQQTADGSKKESPNIKSTFCKYMYERRSDLNVLHIVPKTKAPGHDLFTGCELYEKAYGRLLTIRQDMWTRSRPPREYRYEPDDDWSNLADDEWRGMNEESDGVAYWNID